MASASLGVLRQYWDHVAVLAELIYRGVGSREVARDWAGEGATGVYIIYRQSRVNSHTYFKKK